MVKLRFELAYCDYDWWAICDNESDNELQKELGISGQGVVDLMNELNEENEELIQKNKKVKRAYDVCKFRRMNDANVIYCLEKENKQLKSILQDMGLIMSDIEVKNVRDEIASKLIKPLFKVNGFDVDVNTENGFTIIPKEVNNDRE